MALFFLRGWNWRMNGERRGEDMEGKVKYGPDLRRLLRVIRFLVRRGGRVV